MEDITFLQMITLILIGLLFFRDEIIPWIKIKLGMDPGKSNRAATQAQVSDLAEYVNHRQTEIMEKQTAILESVQVGVESINRKQDEWERFGVPTRPLK